MNDGALCMVMPHRLAPILLIILLASPWIRGADAAPGTDRRDPCDPWASLNPRHAIACLAALRAPLDQAPQDRRLLHLAAMAYITLSFGRTDGLHGACGPWFAYAEEMLERKHRAPGAPTTPGVAEEEPELWMRFMRGDMGAIIQTLDRCPQERDTPAYRALRAAASGDWRELEARAPLTPHERYALLWAGRCCWRKESRLNIPYRDPLLSIDLTAGLCSPATSMDLPQKILYANQVVADAVWMCASPHCPAPRTERFLTAMDKALELPDVSGLDKGQRIQRIERDLLRGEHPCVPPQAYALAVGLVEELRGGSTGLMHEGRHQLVGVGDVAYWLAGRLFCAARAAYDGDTEGENSPGRPLNACLKREAPQALVTADLEACGSSGHVDCSKKRCAVTTPALSAAMAREAARTLPLHDLLLLRPTLALLNHKSKEPPRIQSWLQHMADERTVDLRGLHTIRHLKSVHALEESPPYWAMLRRLGTVNPWDSHFWVQRLWLAPECRLIQERSLPPQVAWREDAIAKADGQWTQLPPTHRLQVRWQGTIEVQRPGRHVFRLQCSRHNCFRLQVGGLVAADPGSYSQGSMTSATLAADLEPGRLPVVLEVLATTGRPECRLTWTPPGSKGSPLLPALPVDGGGGWQVSAWLGEAAWRQTLGPPDEALRFLDAHPYQARMCDLLHDWYTGLEWGEQALAWWRRADAVTPNCHSGGEPEEWLLFCHDESMVQDGLERQHFTRTRPQDGDPPVATPPPSVPKRRLLSEFLGADQTWFLAALSKHGDPLQARRCRGVLALQAGDFPCAWEELGACLERPEVWESPEERILARLEVAALGRLLGKPAPDWQALERALGDQRKPASAALAGRLSAEEARDMAAGGAKTDDIVYYALQWAAIIAGDHAEIGPMAKIRSKGSWERQKTQCEIAMSASEALVRWMAVQTPASLAPLKATKRVGEVRGADGF